MSAPWRVVARAIRRQATGAPVLALWIVAGLALSQITGRVTDWFVMTDELLYERFAISSARSVSPLAEVHGQVTASLNQLYPLLIAPVFRSGLVPHDLHQAHLLNAWLMSSACIPAFLLGRRVTGRRSAAYAIAIASVCVPWMFYASFLLTEVAAYPAFLWAILGMQRAASAPSRSNDLLALGGIALAFYARTQFALLAAVLPIAIIAGEAGSAGRRGLSDRTVGAVRTAIARHRALAAAYALGVVGAIVLAAFGRLHSVLGGYGDTLAGNLPPGLARGLLGHLATLSLGVGILPAVGGIAWLGANALSPPGDRERHAFACLGIVTVIGLLVEVTVFDLRLGVGQIVYDRYLLYLAPVLLLAFLCAPVDRAPLRWSLLVVGALIALGFAVNNPPAFEWQQFATLSPDAPVSVFYRPIVRFAHGLGWARAALAALTIVLTALYAIATRRARSRTIAIAVTALALAAVPAETAYVFHRLFGAPGWSERPLTAPASASNGFAWVDQSVGASSGVTMIPYHVSSAYFVSLRYWRDFEFWNKSVDRTVYFADDHAYRFTGNNFPRQELRIDPLTGAVNTSLTRYVAQSVTESRFRIAGSVRMQTQEVMLIDAPLPWRASWLTVGPYDDGWLKPAVAARIRIFPAVGQREPRIQRLTLQISTADGVTGRPFVTVSNLARFAGVAAGGTTSAVNSLPVCVPADGYADVRVSAEGSSPIPGDLSSLDASQAQREGSIYLADISVSDDIGPRCKVRPARST